MSVNKAVLKNNLISIKLVYSARPIVITVRTKEIPPHTVWFPLMSYGIFEQKKETTVEAEAR